MFCFFKYYFILVYFKFCIKVKLCFIINDINIKHVFHNISNEHDYDYDYDYYDYDYYDYDYDYDTASSMTYDNM